MSKQYKCWCYDCEHQWIIGEKMKKICVECGKNIGFFDNIVQCHEKDCNVIFHRKCFEKGDGRLNKCPKEGIIYCKNHPCECIKENIKKMIENEKIIENMSNDCHVEFSEKELIAVMIPKTFSQKLSGMEWMQENDYILIPETFKDEIIFYIKKVK